MMDELINALLAERRKIAIDHADYDDWTFSIYISNDAYLQIMSEIHGPVHSLALELYENGTMRGNPTYRVIGDKHPAFSIYANAPKKLAKLTTQQR